MKARRIWTFLLNLFGGVMLLAAATGTAQAMTPAKSLAHTSALHASIAVYDPSVDPAKFENVYWHRWHHWRWHPYHRWHHWYHWRWHRYHHWHPWRWHRWHRWYGW